MNLYVSDPYEKAFGLRNAYNHINIEKRSKSALKTSHVEKHLKPYFHPRSRRDDEMQSIIHSLEDDVEYSESDISDVESSEDEDINDDESDFTVSTLHSHPTTPIPTSSTTKHGGELSSILDDEQTPLDENIVNEFFEETYKEGTPVDIILEKQSNKLVKDIYENLKLISEGKEVPDNDVSRLAKDINGKTSSELQTMLHDISAELVNLENYIGNNTNYTVADLKNSIYHEGNGEYNAVKEIAIYDELYKKYMAIGSIIRKNEREIKLKKIVDDINKKIDTKGRDQESNEYMDIVGKIAEELKNAFDKYSTDKASGRGKPTNSAYQVAVSYVKQLSRPGNINIPDRHIGVLRKALPKIKPQLIYKYLDRNILTKEQLINDVDILSELDDLYLNPPSSSKNEHGFTLNHDKVMEHLKSKESGKGYLKAIWDD